MSELDLIRQLGEILGRPLQKLPETWFEQHGQVIHEKGSASQNRISRDAYCTAANGTISGLFLQPVTSHILLDFPFHQFSHVRYLYLSQVNLSCFSFLSELTGLISLSLSNNSITDCSFLSELTGLTSLDLSNNGITDFSFLSELTGLTSLGLSGNGITDFSFLSELTGLTSLNLSFNRVTDFSFLSELTGLTSLGLSGNGITDFSFLSELTRLTSLNLSHNRITEVPQALASGRMMIKTEDAYAFTCINLFENPIEEPPLEIVRQGNAAILSYYAQLDAQGQDHLYEAKMLIVGEGEAGKTTLAHKVAEPHCPLPHIDDRTRGISIQPHVFSCRDRESLQNAVNRNFHLNIWDFGGQEIYHATHRFFLSKRSLYVLVADNRKGNTDFNYWLNIIERFASNSPLIIVLNEKDDLPSLINQAELRSRYPNSIKEITALNFKTQEEPDSIKAQKRIKDIHTLIRQIEHCAQSLPHIGETVPARWVDVRQAIEADSRNYIYREDFDKLCQNQQITASADIDTLLSYFHDLGILLHFASNPLLRNRVILKPSWATNAVYRIFDDDSINAKAGRFTRQDCNNIWRDPQYRHMQDVLIELMKNFRLVYEIGNTGQLVAPQLLPQNTPAYPWNDTHNSHMQLRYDAFMPKGIFWQFAVTMYRYIHDHAWVWRNGMILRRGNTWAEVIEDINLRRISLRFFGPSIAEFRAVIIDELDNISGDFHNLTYDKMIPCQCSECIDSDRPHFFKYAFLKKRQEAKRRDTADCEISDQDVSLSLLLEGFEVQSILQSLPDKREGGPVPPTLVQSGDLSAAKSQAAIQTIKIFLASSSELKEDRKEFEILIGRENKKRIKDGIFLELVIWEDFLNAMSGTRSQDEYNKAISENCDLFIILCHTKVGQYTTEEFDTALEAFKGSGKPKIFTYFKDTAVNMSSITPEIMTLLNFKQRLKEMKHFYQPYADINDLKHQVSEQLDKVVRSLTSHS